MEGELYKKGLALCLVIWNSFDMVQHHHMLSCSRIYEHAWGDYSYPSLMMLGCDCVLEKRLTELINQHDSTIR